MLALHDRSALSLLLCMYTTGVCRALTSLRVCRNRLALLTLCKPNVASPAHLLPTLQRIGLWASHRSCKLHSTVPAAVASTTESLPGIGAQMLLGRADAYEGFIVSADDLPSTSDEFNSSLQQSLQVAACALPTPAVKCMQTWQKAFSHIV